MEACWLLTVGLVPIIFAPPESMPFIDLPKVTLLRSLTGMMAVLWALELAFKPRQPKATASKADSAPSPLKAGLDWLRADPGRLPLVLATLFVAANGLSTLLSISFSVSLWDRNPGRDGYGFYNIASYFILFAAINTHLSSRAQLWRLLGVIVASSTLAAAYGIIQHFGLDPYYIAGERGAYSSFGNRLFAGAFTAMAIPASLGLGVFHGLKSRSPWVWAAWACLIIVQLGGLALTFSRGPWIGLAVGAAAWLVVLGLVLGRRVLTKQVLAMSLLALALAAVAVVAPLPLGDTGDNLRSSLVDRITSIPTEATSDSLSGRYSLWERSVSLIVERPWSDREEREPVFLRHLFGYGPELFRYALSLRWDPDARNLLNACPHNYLIRVTVELGLMGAATYVAFVAVLLAGGWVSLMRGRSLPKVAYSPIYAALLSMMIVNLDSLVKSLCRSN